MMCFLNCRYVGLFNIINVFYQSMLDIAGQGCNGQAIVSLAKHIPSGTLLAVKCINLEKCDLEVHSIQVCKNNNARHN